jgi:ER lumen protein retaining receptor
MFQIAWAFSQYLEALAIIPQLHLISKAGRAEKVVSYYIYGLTAYRTFYILNWAYRYSNEDFRDLVFIVPALFQILVYCDYFFDLLSSRLIPKKRKYVHRIINVNYPTLLLGYDAMPGSPQKMSQISKI